MAGINELKQSLLDRLDKPSLELEEIEKAKPDLKLLNQLLSQRAKERAELMARGVAYE